MLAAFFIGNMSRSRSLLKVHISELCRSFVETSLSYMSDKTYASCRNNEFNRFSECKKCKLKSEMQEKPIKMDIYNDLVGVQVQKAGICSEKDLRNRQNMLSW